MSQIHKKNSRSKTNSSNKSNQTKHPLKLSILHTTTTIITTILNTILVGHNTSRIQLCTNNSHHHHR